jgi:tetratricopeptide (TPR) repeat protein
MNRDAERVVAREAHAGTARIGKRYDQLGMIGRGATGVVYRAHDRLHRRQVALKTALLDFEPGDDPRTSQPIRTSGLLAREFRLLSGLRHPNIVTCMEYGLDGTERPYFTMDLRKDARPLREAMAELAHDAKIELLVQILHALAYLHRRGLVHRDVKPDNVLTTGRIATMIDFGLAAPAGQKDETAVGTPAYSAPEVVRNAPASAAGDLFAVGVIAYEMLAGRHPFDVRTTQTLLRSLFASEIDWSPIEPRTRPVLEKLLARDARARFTGALDVVQALASPLETVSTREAFLQGTELVGRDRELERLLAVVPKVDVHGKAMLVTGESGVGKSRLLEEIGVEAMVRGARVLRGQSLRAGGRPYEPWRAILRALLLAADPTPLEASVVAGIVPDAHVVLERVVEAAPELDPEATHHRTTRVLEALLRRCADPLLVILEDLQWAGAESIALAARIPALGATRPISIVASWRTDGAPAVPKELEHFDSFALEPLTAGSVARLCTTTIGAGADARLSDVVWSQSGGNAFAVLEVIRTLANEAGGLEGVGALAAPERALAGRVERLADRRVERLSDADRAVLRTAAIAGRELGRELLVAVHPNADVDAMAARAIDAAVLASVQGRWWFAHDKLRDAVIEAIPDAERRRIHRELGVALERIAPDDASTLAYHFRAAGDEEREREHAARAGDQFLRSGAYRDAIPHLERALELAAPDTPTRPRLERQLGESLFRCGKLDEAKARLAGALGALGRPLPQSKGALARAMAVEATTQLSLRVRSGRTRADTGTFEEAILAFTQLSRLAHHLNDEPLVLYVTLSALNLADRGGLAVHHARLASVFAAVMGLIPVHKWARFYFASAHALAGDRNDASLRAFILAHEGYYEAGIGRWEECRTHLQESIDLYERIGDVRLAEESISILAYAAFYQGELARSLELYERLQRSGEERGDAQIVSWGLVNRIKVLVRTGREGSVDDAMLARAEGLLVDGITKAVHDGVRIDLALARGDLALARKTADEATARLKASPPRSFMARSTYASIVDAYVACKAEREAARAAKALASIKRIFPVP